MEQFNLILLLVSLLVLAVGLCSHQVNRVPLSPPLVAFAAGLFIGPLGIDALDTSYWFLERDVLLEQGSRLALAVGLMGIALRLPPRYFFNRAWTMTVVLAGLMTAMWLVSSLLAYAILGLEPLAALLLGAVITPTDPILATSVVTGPLAHENIPARIRHLISAESGANDGLAYVFVFLPLLLFDRSPSEALLAWGVNVLLWEVGVAVVAGATMGYLAARLLRFSERHEAIGHTYFLSFTLALSLAALAGAKLLGTDGVLCVFVAGMFFTSHFPDSRQRDAERDVQEAVARFFLLPIFFYLGLVIPGREWLSLGWLAVVFVVAVIVLRRLPAVLLMRRAIRPLRSRADALIYGWFGPIGVSGIFYVVLALRHKEMPEVWLYGSLLVAASIVVYGITAAPLTRWYGRRG